MEQREIFRRNEADANRYAALCMRVAAVVAALMWVLNLLGFFIVDPVLMNLAMPVGISSSCCPPCCCGCGGGGTGC